MAFARAPFLRQFKPCGHIRKMETLSLEVNATRRRYSAPSPGPKLTPDIASSENSERIDKWLWAARFFKTRSLAAEAIASGKVDVDGERTRKGRSISPGATVTVRKGPYSTTVLVRSTAMRRGSAQMAAQLYEETSESKTAREKIRVQLSSLPFRPTGEGRPGKKERRQIRKLRGRDP
jgi:ribosome-associated heat shock protein Hsp15